MTRAIVVGSGPNGLAAAITLARAGVEVTVLEARDSIGGGTRTAELTAPGLLHDVCSAFHPLGASSPFLRSLPLKSHGVRWRHAPLAVAHPLDDGRVGVLARRGSAAGSFDPGVDIEAVLDDVMQPLLHLPRRPVALARFAARGLLPATTYARGLGSDVERASFAGCAAHAFRPLTAPMSASFGLLLASSASTYGWPVAEGGSAAITRAMASYLSELGGVVETGVEVTALPSSDLVLLDVHPRAALRILAGRLPARVRRSYERFQPGPAAYKLDLAISGPVPWTNPVCGEAATVHVGGTLEEIAAAEDDVSRGRMPVRPFVLVGQQFVADPTRSVGDLHPLWLYAHVPNGFTGDATQLVLAQVERFAPGFRERIRELVVTGPAGLEVYNPNFVGGDISTGAHTMRQLVARPRLLRPYDTGVPGAYLCSAATPPGGGVHGMCGHHAAIAALRSIREV